ncbi:MAG: ribonuclease HI [Eubacterium sp.]|nr:ribonuclease HI [Eubacterium sp.]
MSETGKELMKLLKEIYDNHDFVCGSMSNAGGEAAWNRMKEYIQYKKQNKLEITSDEILALSLVLGDEFGENKSGISNKIGKIAAF